MHPFINAHTHHKLQSLNIFGLFNLIVGRDTAVDVNVCTAGIHPWYIDQDQATQIKKLKDIVRENKVIAIGECGLDKLCDTDWDLQIDIFQQQIVLANTLNKPLIIHCVRAYQEVIQQLSLQRSQVPVIFHGFNKNDKLSSQLLKKGFYLSLGASILHGRQDALISEIPLDRVFLETDDKTTSIVDIFSYFCAARKITLPELKQQMVENLEQVFNYRIEE